MNIQQINKIANIDDLLVWITSNQRFGLGREEIRKSIAKTYAEWCFERRMQLPAEFNVNSKEHLQKLFETCYPFHPAVFFVFQRKWQTLQQYQQTRGTLAMLAQWVSLVFHNHHEKARKEALITLGSAPLDVLEFRSVVLGQLGNNHLDAAITYDIAGDKSHAYALDTGQPEQLQDIHRRVGTAIFFESLGGQTDKSAHLPELRFALCEPNVDTATVDNAAMQLEAKSYYLRKAGSDAYKIGCQPTIKKVVSDRKASLDEDTEVKPEIKKWVKEQFEDKSPVPIIAFPDGASDIPDSPKLTLVLADPSFEWTGDEDVLSKIADLTINRGVSRRICPAALVWCIKKTGRALYESVENYLAWRRVGQEIKSNALGAEVSTEDKEEVEVKTRTSKKAVCDEVWGSYCFAVLYDPKESSNLKVIDLGAGHSSSGSSLSFRIIDALRSQGFLNETVGSGYIERNWPPAFKLSGAWPLASFRESFLNGVLTRLPDPDKALRTKICEFIKNGSFALASGKNADGSYQHIWFKESLPNEEVLFENDVFLLTQKKARELKQNEPAVQTAAPSALFQPAAPEAAPVLRETESTPEAVPPSSASPPVSVGAAKQLHLFGEIPPDVWNRIGTKIIPKLRSDGGDLQIKIDLSVKVNNGSSESFKSDINQIIEDLGLTESVKVEACP